VSCAIKGVMHKKTTPMYIKAFSFFLNLYTMPQI
jgi:hypothetical protein